MRRRVFVSLSVLALVFGAAIPTTAAAASPVHRFQKIHVTGVDPQVLPYMIDKNRQLNLMVELSDQPVAAQVGNATDNGTTATASDRSAWRSKIKTSQAPIVAAVKAHGGRVMSQVQDAYNGVHVHLAAGSVAAIAALPGVVAVHLVTTYKPMLTKSVPYVGAPQAWSATGETGAGEKIAVIDTGIDFYHADFGGSGNPADYTYGLAHDTAVPAKNADGTTVAFPNAKIPVGYDFVGDAYDASATAGSPATIPQFDGNPLDCDSHGTHTASTAAGFGELANGSTYHGPYTPAVYGTKDFKIGPGVAPNAQLYIYKVFGCLGTTDVVTEAINKAVQDGADVISMSLGSDFGTSDTPDAAAAENASRAGVVVVAASGNEGSSAYMAGTPASSSRTISVAALDSNATFPGATIQLSPKISALDANNGPLPVTGKLVVLTSGGAIGLGCDASDYSGVHTGDIVVTTRGVCARVLRAQLGQAAHASAVIMVNNGDGLPPFEGPIAGVTIPFIGVSESDGAALLAADGTPNVTIVAAGMLTNPTYKQLADFTSYGPRFGDSALKPEVTAPGVSIVAAGMGTGSDVLVDSGTSMATPHIAGVAALVLAANPHWSVNEVKAAIMSTASDTSATIVGYDPIGAGSGVVQAQQATTTQAIALTSDHLDSLAFGYRPLGGSFSAVKSFIIENKGFKSITYNLAASFVGGSAGAKVKVSPSRLSVPAHQSRSVAVTLSMSAAAVAALPAADTFAGVGPGALLSVEGVVTAKPTASGAGIYSLHVPFLLVPRGDSKVVAGPPSPYQLTADVASATVPLKNVGLHSGTADVYSWGISDKDHTTGIASIRAVGVQSLPASTCGAATGDACLVFAINGWHQWSNAAAAEYDIGIDTNNDGSADFIVVGLDLGEITTGSFNGVEASFEFDAGGNLIAAYYADAPMNGSVIELPAIASEIGVTAGSPTFTYSITGVDLITGTVDAVAGTAKYNAFTPTASNGQFVSLASGASATLPISVTASLQATTPALGWMVVSLDNANGAAQAALIPVGKIPAH